MAVKEVEPKIEILSIKLKNKRLVLTPTPDGCYFTSKTLTKDTGKGKSTIHNLSKNKKIKYTSIHLSDESAIGLYHLLKEYLKQ